MNKVKVSVIIPCYNSEKYLDRCLGNLLKTDFKDFEIICINDGSKDNTLKILRNYARKYEKIVIINQKNQGQAIGRNNALKKAKGEYISFVDSDDFVSNEMIQIMYEKAIEHSSELVYCDYYEYYGVNKLKLCKNKVCEDMQKNAVLANFAPWGKLYKTSFFKKNKFQFLPGKLFEDIAVVPIVAALAKNPIYVEEPLYFYNMENESSIRRKTYNKKLEDIMFVSDYLYEELNKYDLIGKYKEEIEYMYLDSILKGGVLRFASFKEGIKHIKALRKSVLKKFPDLLKNKYLKSSSIYLKLITYISVKFPPMFIYLLKKVK